jgi:predicted nuclease of predicted toxin-antitoxin system
MKLLFDENLSPKLVEMLADVYPDSAQVDRVGMGSASDLEVWEYAKSNGFVIVSKDSDYQELNTLKGHPPKFIWLRRGNCSTHQIEYILRANSVKLLEFEQDNDLGYLMLL